MELRSDRSVLPPDSNAMTRSFLKLEMPKATLLTRLFRLFMASVGLFVK